MDPITHALVGAGVAGLSGGEMSITNPVVLATIIGSVAPDSDIIYQIKGDMAYLKTHRGFSHSLPGLALFSGLIGLGLGQFFPEVAVSQLIFWAFAGALSHTLLDMLNSYGAQIFAPFSKKRFTGNLLMITDPMLLMFFLSIFIFPGNVQMKSNLAIGGFGCYLLGRLILRKRVEKHLARKFAVSKLKRLAVMPSMMGMWTWDFVVETERKCLVGQIHSFNFMMNIRKKMTKFKKSELVKAALESKMGKLFTEFTPHFHLVFNEVNDKYVVDFLDLRYLLKKDFLHTGTAVFDHHLQEVEAMFYPYSKRRKVDLSA
ncbi:MAG: metal-dependent hydrolase [Clostridia bacterium]|nr:metal-dependent hydrolase [Clostridia bacterium]